jgi:ankyrin repeat protein
MSFLKRLKGTNKEHFVVAHFDAYQDGALAEKERALYEGHLAACGECQAWAQRQESLVARLGMEIAPAVLAPAAAKRIQKDLYRSMRRAVIMNNIRTSAATVGALAVLALVVGVFVLWQAGSFGSGVQLPLLNQGPAAQEEVVLSDQDEDLLKALANDDVDELASLLEAGADPNAQSSPGRPALYLATLHGNAEVVRLLIDHGADVQAETVDGAILVKATVEGHREIVEMLLDGGADVNATGRDWTPEDTALLAAANHGHLGIAELLIERGADVNYLDSHGGTALMTAAGRGRPEIVTLLLENGADAYIDHQEVETYTSGIGTTQEWPAGRTALHFAVSAIQSNRENKLEVVRILIEHGAALDIEDEGGQTPLDLALPGSEMWQLLREAGATEGQGSGPGLESLGESSDE